MPPIPMSRIIVAVDGSNYAELALDYGLDFARRYGGQLTIVAVAPLTAYVVSTEPWVPTEVLEGEVRHYEQIVSAAVQRAQKEGVNAVTGVCLEGHIAEELVAFLEKHPADLLIMGSRGLSATKRLLLGSTSDEVLHHVGCPVLIVRQPPITPGPPPPPPGAPGSG
jgi:nucleotide-binding universal stress UspA family protein